MNASPSKGTTSGAAANRAWAHPAFAALLAATAGKSALADAPLAAVRKMMEERGAARKGPALPHVRDLQAEGPAGPIPLRLYSPASPVGIVVAFHGGGWMTGSLNTFDAVCRHLAALSGAAVVSVDYRLAPEHPFPAAIEDAWAATKWIAALASELGAPDNSLALFGESAGGNLAAVVALMARDAGGPAIRRQVLVYPAVDARLNASSLSLFADGYLQTRKDVVFAFETYALKSGADPSDWRLSPVLAASHVGVAPAFIVSAECDAIADDAAAYARRLQAQGVAATHVRYGGMIHTFFAMRGVVDEAEIAQIQVAEELRRALAP
jgi:acetyl esterase